MSFIKNLSICGFILSSSLYGAARSFRLVQPSRLTRHMTLPQSRLLSVYRTPAVKAPNIELEYVGKLWDFFQTPEQVHLKNMQKHIAQLDQKQHNQQLQRLLLQGKVQAIIDNSISQKTALAAELLIAGHPAHPEYTVGILKRNFPGGATQAIVNVQDVINSLTNQKTRRYLFESETPCGARYIQRIDIGPHSVHAHVLHNS